MAPVSPDTAKTVPPAPMDLNDAALAILRAAPPPIREIVLEICKIQHCQPWHLMLGHLLRADQRAELHAPLLLPEWTDQAPTPGMTTTGDRLCKACKRPMVKVPDWADFCCNFCGSGRWDREQIHHEACEFYIKPRTVLHKDRLQQVPPEDPAARLLWEEAMFQRHLEEAQAAESSPGGLPPVPDLERTAVR